MSFKVADRDSTTSPGSLSPTSGHLLLALVLLALVIRLSHFLIILPGPMVTYHRTAPESDMYVFDQWARRIADGDLLSREIYYPLHHWQLQAAPREKWMEWRGDAAVFFKAPLYPYLVALLYGLFGEAMLPSAVLQIVVSSLSVLLLFRIAERLFCTRSAFWAALLFSLYAPAIHYDVFMLRGSWILFLSLLTIHQLLHLRFHPNVGRAILLGLTSGILVLLNEGSAPLPFLVALLLAWWSWDIRLTLKLQGGFWTGLLIIFIPLLARNLVVGAPALSLSALGSVIFASSNAADTPPFFFSGVPSSFSRIMDETYGSPWATVWATLSTFEGDLWAMALFYLRKAAGLIMPFEYPDNANFYYASLQNPLLGFLPGYSVVLSLSVIGVAFGALKSRDWPVLLPATLSLIVAMMISHPNSRYRAVLAVHLMPFAGLAMTRMVYLVRARRPLAFGFAVAVSLLVFVGAKALERQVVFKGLPIERFKYRSFEFWIGSEVYAREKRYQEAFGELLQLARLNPNPSIRSRALLTAAEYQMLDGKKGLAERSLKEAAEIGGDDPEFLARLGDFYLKIFNDAPEASEQYRRALKLNPPDPLRDSLRRRLSSLLEDQRRP